MIKLLTRAVLLAGVLALGACASAPPPPVANFAAPPPRHADAKTTLENQY